MTELRAVEAGTAIKALARASYEHLASYRSLLLSSLPIGYRLRLGRRFDPPQNPVAFQQELERYCRSELQPRSSSCR